jgi:NADH-quinone oxidoreductase subunit L
MLFLAAALGKSAQLPLTAWLPEAMIGPTPVSALIHSATMVAAGVYLILRLFPLFQAAPPALDVVLWIGGVTAMFAAIAATAQTDLKRVLAWSTVSQLGEMLIALGLGAPIATALHLTTHAVFKACLFLGAGVVERAAGRMSLRSSADCTGACHGPLRHS